MNDESIYTIKLSYSEIETILHALYSHLKLTPNEYEKLYTLGIKLGEQRCFENIAEVQS